MLNPRLVSDSDGVKGWFECPFCYEIFEDYKSSIKGLGGTTSSCGCKRAGDGYKTTKEEQTAILWLKRQIKNEKEDLPPILRKLTTRREIAYEWNTDANTEAANNFITFISPKPPQSMVSWKDPLGPIAPENFEWKLNAVKGGTG
jgi:hypothetical protein